MSPKRCRERYRQTSPWRSTHPVPSSSTPERQPDRSTSQPAWLKAGKLDLYREDIKAVIDAAESLPVKVILECHYLGADEIVQACDIAADAGVAYVKTGTGWAETGATIENIALMKRVVGDRCQVKAAGGVADRQTLLAMHAAGATRFGIGVRTGRSILEGDVEDA